MAKLKFPSPLEVYRFISGKHLTIDIRLCGSFRPLSRYIGLYHVYMYVMKEILGCFRPLSRYIGLYPHILCSRQLLETQDVGPTGNIIYIVPYDCRPIKA